MRSDSCARSSAALDVRNAWPRMSIDASIRNGARLHAALAARERARRARIQDHDAQIGGGALHAGAQLVVADAVAADQQAVLVGVARVVDEQLAAHARRACRRAAAARCRRTRRRTRRGWRSTRTRCPRARRRPASAARGPSRARRWPRSAACVARRAAVVDAREQHEAAQAHRRRRRGARRGGGGRCAVATSSDGRSGTAGTAPRARAGSGFRVVMAAPSWRRASCRARARSVRNRAAAPALACAPTAEPRARARPPSRSRPRTASSARTRKKRSKAGASSSSYADGQAVLARVASARGASPSLPLGPVQRHLARAVDRQQHAVAAASRVRELQQIAARGARAVVQTLLPPAPWR